METWKEFDQNIISHSAAHHLMAIDDLVGKLGYARVSDVARLLNITRGSVSISLQPLKKADLVVQDENRHVRLSTQGQTLVDAIKTKRRLIERLLTEVLGVNADWAEVDACKIEHLLSNASAQRLVQLFRFLDNADPPVIAFTKALRAFHGECSHDPKLCPTCENDCMAERLSKD